MAKANSTSTRIREDRAIYRALQIVRQRLYTPSQAMSSPADVRNYLSLLLAEEEREVFMCLFLDAQNRVIADEIMFYGTLTQTSVYPREVVKQVLHHNAASVIFAHNHPSGASDPSNSDQILTAALKNALALIDVRTLDHFIVAADSVTSFAERGLLGSPQPQAEPPKRARRKMAEQQAA